MSPSTRLGPALDDRLDGLPGAPPERYLAAGRSALRRQRTRRAGVVGGVVAAVAAAVLGAGPLSPTGPAPRGPVERDPAVATETVPGERTLSSLQVEPGIGSIDAFTTDTVPSWASTRGRHEPAAIAPDGRLWIAPEATVVRTVADPFDTAAGATGVTSSYAVEARLDPTADDQDEGLPLLPLDEDGVVWLLVYQWDDAAGTVSQLDLPRDWTTDFGLWAEDQVAEALGRPGFAERLVHFADDRSDALEPGAGVEIVRSQTDVTIGDRQRYSRQTAAQVRIDGQTWFVLATGGRGWASYEAFDPVVAGTADLDGFLGFVNRGFLRRGGDS